MTAVTVDQVSMVRYECKASDAAGQSKSIQAGGESKGQRGVMSRTETRIVAWPIPTFDCEADR